MRSRRRGYCVLRALIAGAVCCLAGDITWAQQPSPPAGSMAVRPFKIQVDDAVLEDLKLRLARTRFPDQIEGSAWDYGVDLEYMQKLVEYWRTKYDWRTHEQRLNQFEQFVTTIDGLDI